MPPAAWSCNTGLVSKLALLQLFSCAHRHSRPYAVMMEAHSPAHNVLRLEVDPCHFSERYLWHHA